ncbi:MAG: nucleic acid-binding protein [Treponema sp.]|nr:nucleic acid-binding protein [Treponema sp.]
MQMSEQIDKLIVLQDVLAEKYEIEEKVEEKPKELNAKTEYLDQYKAEYIQINAESEAQNAKVKELKSALEETMRTRESKEKEMDAITTHREYEVLDKEIQRIQGEEDKIRKDLQTEEKRLSELEDRLKGQEMLISSTEKSVNEDQETLNKEISVYKARLDELAAQEKETSSSIDGETIIKFQRIIRRNRKGIVAVRGNVCDGCHMILPAQFANEVRKGDKILFCPYCSRILFYEETSEEDADYSTLDVVGSLVDLDDEFADNDTDFSSQDGYEESGDDEEDEDEEKSVDYEAQ